MGFRFRIGPFTFGRSGARFSIWKGGTGASIPLSKKKKAYGKIRFGPLMWFFGGTRAAQSDSTHDEFDGDALKAPDSPEMAAIEALASDSTFLERLRKYGVPWRGLQEHLKGNLPNDFPNRNDFAYRLVPKAMDAVFGPQQKAWKTEKRPAKSGKGKTTWIVVLETSA